MEGHENAKDAKRRLQQYKARIVAEVNEESRELMRKAFEQVISLWNISFWSLTHESWASLSVVCMASWQNMSEELLLYLTIRCAVRTNTALCFRLRRRWKLAWSSSNKYARSSPNPSSGQNLSTSPPPQDTGCCLKCPSLKWALDHVSSTWQAGVWHLLVRNSELYSGWVWGKVTLKSHFAFSWRSYSTSPSWTDCFLFCCSQLRERLYFLKLSDQKEEEEKRDSILASKQVWHVFSEKRQKKQQCQGEASFLRLLLLPSKLDFSFYPVWKDTNIRKCSPWFSCWKLEFWVHNASLTKIGGPRFSFVFSGERPELAWRYGNYHSAPTWDEQSCCR